ncbi:MAG: site-specific integrase [Lachnospiraceae bacterium]|nr:site-specific integrase [Lachnospiraceae bacterium]
MAKKKKDKQAKLTGFSVRTDGRLMYQFKLGDKRYTVYGMTVEECMSKREKKIKEIENGKYKSAKKITMNEYFERWIDAKTGTVKETTIRTDTILLTRISATVIDESGTTFGDLILTKVESQNIRDLQKALLNEIVMKGKDGKEHKRKGMTTRAANDAIYLLKSVFKTAIEERVIEWNPVTVKPLKRTEPLARDTIHRALTRQETKLFLKKAHELDSAYYNLYVFLLNTGARLGEAGALFIADVGKDGAHICRTITRTEDGGYMIGEDTKTAAGRRLVPMNAAARKAWDDQKNINAMLSDGKIIGLKTPVFKAPRGSLLKSANVNADIKRVCEKAGIERFSVHAFRDSFATRCVESGMQVKTLQEILGHTDVSMTLGLYAHCMDDQKQEQLKAVNFI